MRLSTLFSDFEKPFSLTKNFVFLLFRFFLHVVFLSAIAIRNNVFLDLSVDDNTLFQCARNHLRPNFNVFFQGDLMQRVFQCDVLVFFVLCSYWSFHRPGKPKAFTFCHPGFRRSRHVVCSVESRSGGHHIAGCRGGNVFQPRIINHLHCVKSNLWILVQAALCSTLLACRGS